MTVGQHVADCQAPIVDQFAEFKVYDESGNQRTYTLVWVGTSQSIDPAQPADAGYFRMELKPL